MTQRKLILYLGAAFVLLVVLVGGALNAIG